MRAIDADELKKKAFGKRGGLIHTADIDAMPTIEPERQSGREVYQAGYAEGYKAGQEERKTGKWIRTRTMEHDGELYCDQCEQEHPEQKIIWNFCPNCGARMVQEGEDNECE